MSEPPDEQKNASGSGSTDRTDSHKSVRSVAVGAASLAVIAVAVIGFAIAGPFGLLGAGALTAGGGVVAARVRNPRQRGTRPGLLATLAGRPRRTRTRTWSKMFPLTSQALRERRKGTGAVGRGGGTGKGRRRGMHLPQMPALTKRGQANRAAAHLGSHATGRRGASAPRAAAKPGVRPGAGRPGAKPGGTRAPSTSSRTPARAGSARKLAVAPGGTGRARKRAGSGAVRGATGPGGVGTARRSSRGSGGAQRRRAGRGGIPRVGGAGVRPSTGARPVRRTHRTGVTKPANGKRPRTGQGTRPNSSRTRRTAPPSSPGTRTRRNARPHGTGYRGPVSPRTTSSGTRRRTTRGGTSATRRARRMATPKYNRIDHRTPKVPNRTGSKPRPFTKTPTRKLIRTAMRVPKRDGWRVTRPTKLQQRVARRHLNRRARVLAGRGIRATLKSPFLLARASYRHRPLWIWPTAPGPINPDWLNPTEPAKLRPQADPRPKRPDDVPVPPGNGASTKPTRRHRNPYPKVNARRAPAGTQPTTTGGTTTMAGPADNLADAFASIANFTPQTPEELEQFLASNAEMVQQFGVAFQTLAQRMTSEMPLAAPVAQGTTELGVALAACHGIAGQIHSTYAAAHQVEKDRRENPRPNEGFWDVGNR